MRLGSMIRKCVVEQVRDSWSLLLAVLTGATFVLLFWSFTGGKSSVYKILIVDNDRPVTAPDGTPVAAGKGIADAMRAMKYQSGQPMLDVAEVRDRCTGEQILRDREAHALVILPHDLSASVAGLVSNPPEVEFVGDLTHPLYTVAAVLGGSALDGWLVGATMQEGPYRFVEKPLGGSGSRTEFEAYIPGLLIISILMSLFTSAMSVSREVESGTLRRLKLTRMTAVDFIAGVSVTQILVSLASLVLTFGVATALGFRSVGPLWAALLVSALATLSVIGVGLVIACFSKTVTRAFLVANVPFTVMMFFSGALFPIPKVELFHVAGRTVGLWDILPPTHAVIAINKILSLGAGLGDVTWELCFLAGLSILYFGLGIWIFRHTHLSPA